MLGALLGCGHSWVLWTGGNSWLELTTAVYIVFRLGDILPVLDSSDLGLFADVAVALAQDDDLVPRDLVLLDRFADDLLADAVAVYIGCVPGVEATVVSCFQQGKCFLFVDDPGLPCWVAETHGAEDGDGDAQTTVSKALVGCFCLCDGAQDGVLLGGAIGSRHCDVRQLGGDSRWDLGKQ